MKKTISRETEQDIEEAILDIPFRFEVGERKYRLYHPTLGKIIRLRRYTAELAMAKTDDVAKDAMSAVLARPLSAARIIAIHTLETKEEILDADIIEARAHELMDAKEMELEDMTSLLVVCINSTKQAEKFIEATPISIDQKNREKANKVKRSRNSLLFGGRTIYGQLIDTACERYGWSMQYVLWGISYTNLKMMLADQTTSVYLDDKELKKAHIVDDRNAETIDAGDPANIELLKQILKD